MDFTYDKDTDSLYIALSPKTSTESEEVAPGIVVDYDALGHIVGLDIEDASKHTSLSHIHVAGFKPEIDCSPVL